MQTQLSRSGLRNGMSARVSAQRMKPFTQAEKVEVVADKEKAEVKVTHVYAGPVDFEELADIIRPQPDREGTAGSSSVQHNLNCKTVEKADTYVVHVHHIGISFFDSLVVQIALYGAGASSTLSVWLWPGVCGRQGEPQPDGEGTAGSSSVQHNLNHKTVKKADANVVQGPKTVLVNTTDIIELDMKSKRFNLLVRKKEAIKVPEPIVQQMMAPPQYAPQQMMASPPAAAPAPAPASAPAASAPAPAAPPPPAAAARGIELMSPMGGTFYRSPAPGEPAFVKEGDNVKKGQVVGLVEAMKLMNEIEEGDNVKKGQVVGLVEAMKLMNEIEEGDNVKKGQVVGLVEAMKLMNEIEEGDNVKKGQVVGLVEAMKLMNEIEEGDNVKKGQVVGLVEAMKLMNEIEEGDNQKKGQVVGLVEAMRLMNEIEAECDGKVISIIESGTPITSGMKVSQAGSQPGTGTGQWSSVKFIQRVLPSVCRSSSAYRNSVSRVLLLVGLATLLTISCVLAIKSDSSSEPIHSAGLSDLGEASGKSAMKHRVIIVGGGLAGLASAVSAHEAILSSGLDAEIVIMEKTPKLGGNSMKASSGMNALTVDSGDASELYKADTLASGGGLSKEELVSTLVANSAEAVDALEKLGVNLSKITWMGGHSVARTHSNPVGGNVGFSIMKVMIDHVNTLPGVRVLTNTKVMIDYVNSLPGVRVLTNTKLEKLVVDGGRVKGVVATQTDDEERIVFDCDAVILACGGFGANKELISARCTSYPTRLPSAPHPLPTAPPQSARPQRTNSLLQSKSSAAASLATTNGPWATGDALDIASNIGASLIHLDQVQIHPTGLVDPKDPDAGTKFLAPEKLRGVGGILLTAEGHRFVDELSTRDVVSGAMLE
eukprot:gene19452-26114_t